MSENRQGGMGGNRKFRLKRYGVGGMFIGMQRLPPRPAPCTERPAQQSIQGHGSNLRALPRPQQVTLFHSHRNPRQSHDQTSAQRSSSAPHPPVGCTGSSCWQLPCPKCIPSNCLAIRGPHKNCDTGLFCVSKVLSSALT